ncbi:MAG: cytochrome c3 family protein [Desulfovibrio sp.]|nr:cytochrome c3 family protein [Desulfovibrio sp.]
MKYIHFFLLMVALLFAAEVKADSIKEMAESIQKPISLKSAKTALLSVTFNHTSHRGISCFTCHHMPSEKNGRYISCSQCHKDVGRSKEANSLFSAFHNKESKHSCYACHLRKAKEKPELYATTFVNCRPCHSRMTNAIQGPMTIKASKSPLLNVSFNHSSHQGINCFTCHHKVSEKGRYVGCEECHLNLGRTTEKASMFNAFHNTKSSHACYACHLKKVQAKPERFAQTFYNCRPCHKAAVSQKSK